MTAWTRLRAPRVCPAWGTSFGAARTVVRSGPGPIAKNVGPEVTENLRVDLGLSVGDAAFFVGGKPDGFQAVAAKARDAIGRALRLIDENQFSFCWIVDFPMFERDEDSGGLTFSHNPFSMPQGGMEALEQTAPLDLLGHQYDIVCNGVELSSGAVRNHRLDILYKLFEIVGCDAAYVRKHFGGMVNALRYGAPPHAGIAPGIERIVMLLTDAENIREVTMFPLNQRAGGFDAGRPERGVQRSPARTGTETGRQVLSGDQHSGACHSRVALRCAHQWCAGNAG